MKTIQRAKSRRPRIIRMLRIAGLALVTGSTSLSLLAKPVAVPEAVKVTAVVIAVTGAVITVVCQALAEPVKRKEDKGDGGAS